MIFLGPIREWIYNEMHWANYYTEVWKDRHIQTVTAQAYLPTAEAFRATSCWKHLHGNFDKSLQGEFLPAWEWTTLWSNSLRGGAHSLVGCLSGDPAILSSSRFKNAHFSLWYGVRRRQHYEMQKKFSITNVSCPREITSPESNPPGGRVCHRFQTPSPPVWKGS